LLNESSPPYIPSDASLYLGKDDGRPYKLVLMGRPVSVLLDKRKAGPDGRRIGSLSSLVKPDPTKLILEYTNVKLYAAILVDEFAFQAPSTALVDDNTEVIIVTWARSEAWDDAPECHIPGRRGVPVVSRALSQSFSLRR
jgi:hypothetical protein